jgi:recombination protein RecT
MSTTTPQTATNGNLPDIQKTIADKVLARVKAITESGGLTLPQNYSAENAIRSAYLILSQQTNKEGHKIIDIVTKESISETFLDMVVQGLNPAKKQCYFIPYGNKLSLSRSYFGTQAIAKRVDPNVSIGSEVIYEKDTFTYQINKQTGKKELIEHVQDINNIDNGKIKGAYAIVNGELTVMTIGQIRNSWNQGRAKGQSDAHKNFTDEMCKKTVVGRALKTLINSSDDAYLYEDKAPDTLAQDPIVEEQEVEAVTVEMPIEAEEPMIVEAKEEEPQSAVVPENLFAQPQEQNPAKPKTKSAPF